MKLTALAIIPVAGALLSMQGAGDLLKSHVSGLSAAKSLKVSFTVQPVPGTPADFTLAYSKPDLLKIETPASLYVTDGKTVWSLDKAANTYTEAAGSANEVLARAMQDDVWAWAAFFGDAALKELKAANTGAKRNLKGAQVTELALVLPDRSATLYMDGKLGVARGMSLKKGTSETLVLAKEIELGKEPLDPALFAFTPPAGAKKEEKKIVSVPYTRVASIFRNACNSCHSSANRQSGLDLSTHAGVMAGGSRGKAVVPGKGDDSMLVQMLTGKRAPAMPMGRGPLSQGEINTIRAWIDAGAKAE